MYLLLIPIFNALTGWLSIFLFMQVLFKYVLPRRWQTIQHLIIKKLQEFAVPGLIRAKIQELDLEKEVSPLLDLRLDRLIEQLKKQVPMGEYFLSGAFVERLKARAKEEILQTLPEIKERLIEKAEREFDLNTIIEDQVYGLSLFKFESFVRTKFRSDLLRAQAFGFFLGLLLGIFEYLLFFLIHLS